MAFIKNPLASLIGLMRQGRRHTKPINRRKDTPLQKAFRRMKAEQAIERKVASNVHLFPPQQGHRRPEWSSNKFNEWSPLNGIAENAEVQE